jgi:hypothetical protein
VKEPERRQELARLPASAVLETIRLTDRKPSGSRRGSVVCIFMEFRFGSPGAFSFCVPIEKQQQGK